MEGKDSGAGGIAGRKLLESPNFGATPDAAGDLESGIVDRRLIAALGALTREHRICVDAFKEGHYFLPGVPDGPRIPKGYGKAGGLPNTHYFGRAADIRWVDGKPVEGNATDPTVLEVGRTLAGLPPEKRPDQIIGPPGWTRALGYGYEEGWISAPDQLELHKDHIHIGYMEEKAPQRTLAPGAKNPSGGLKAFINDDRNLHDPQLVRVLRGVDVASAPTPVTVNGSLIAGRG